VISEMAARRAIVAIGIDPGIAAVGFGVVRTREGCLELVAHGCIQTESSVPTGKRLAHIFNEIKRLLQQYAPDVGGIEELYFFRNVSSAFPVAEARGVIRLAFEEANIELMQHTPNAIKKSVTGSARADKYQVQEMVRILLGMKEIPKPDHAADALAAAICTLHSIGPAGYTL
jgi:crossover junction endodeoxyribonuclease RuvC